MNMAKLYNIEFYLSSLCYKKRLKKVYTITLNFKKYRKIRYFKDIL